MSDQPTNGKTVGDLAQEILNRIVTDADFRQQVASNPEETLAQAGYTAGDDVSGYILSLGNNALGSGGGAGRVLGGGGDGGRALGGSIVMGPKVDRPRPPAPVEKPIVDSGRNPLAE